MYHLSILSSLEGLLCLLATPLPQATSMRNILIDVPLWISAYIFWNIHSGIEFLCHR